MRGSKKRHKENIQLFWNQLHYLEGQYERLQKCFSEECSPAERLHILQTVEGSTKKLLLLFVASLRDKIYTLTDTPTDTKNADIQILSNLLAIKKGTPTTAPSKLPLIIDFLEALKNNSASESI